MVEQEANMQDAQIRGPVDHVGAVLAPPFIRSIPFEKGGASTAPTDRGSRSPTLRRYSRHTDLFDREILEPHQRQVAII